MAFLGLMAYHCSILMRCLGRVIVNIAVGTQGTTTSSGQPPFVELLLQARHFSYIFNTLTSQLSLFPIL